MDTLEQLDRMRKLPIVYYHRFLMAYKKNSDDLYVFCEGDADLSYYCEQIERYCPEREIIKIPSECKNNVIQIWKCINWDEFQRNRVLFFVDRDLSYWVGEPQYYDTNVYVTDGYSFENDAVNQKMFLKILEDIYGFSNYTSDEKNKIKKEYINKWNEFKEGSYEPMAYALYTYAESHEHNAKNVSMHKCINFGNASIWRNFINGDSRENYFRKQFKIVGEDAREKISEFIKVFLSDDMHYSIRGKWSLEFMIDLLEYIYINGKEYAPSLYLGETKKPKKIVELTARGAMAVLGPKINPPRSLTNFIQENIG